MRKKKWLIILIILILAAGGGFAVYRMKTARKATKTTEEIAPVYGDILLSVSTTGVVEPQNRLEIKPTIGGRVEEILVREGDRVRDGQILAWLSSTERAALLDAAQNQGEETFRYWEEAYKPFPLIAPIDGEVIVRAVEPGQTVSTSTAVVVLSDRLIVKAQVDETDIGRVKEDQAAVVSLDAYPDVKVKAHVDHIAYESKTISNVTIYEVDILPDRVPPVFRSGMSADVEIFEDQREGVLTLPESAIKRKRGKSFVLVSQGKGKEPRRLDVELGLTDGERVEIISGLGENDRVLVSSGSYSPERNSGATNPFSPWDRRRRRPSSSSSRSRSR